MSEMVRESARDPAVRRAALDLVQTYYASSYDDFVNGVRSLFLRNFRWIDEPDELITPPGRLLRSIQESGCAWGDCDDGAVLAASLFYALGFAVRFRAILEAPDGSFQHVFTEFRAPQSDLWRVFDPSINHLPRYDSSLVSEV
jgi:transglutaminase-like putative cysteine protease